MGFSDIYEHAEHKRNQEIKNLIQKRDVLFRNLITLSEECVEAQEYCPIRVVDATLDEMNVVEKKIEKNMEKILKIMGLEEIE